MKDNILIVAAHSDDQIIGVGGTAAKYVQKGFKVTTVIVFSGEESHPHFKEEIIINTRMYESLKANEVIGGKKVEFFSFEEKSFSNKEFAKAKDMLDKIVNRQKPTKIFTHSPEDHHPGHKKISNLVLNVVDLSKRKIEVYTFDIWNPFRWDKKNHPKLVIDTGETFDKKMKALKCFKSQFDSHAFLNYVPLATMYVKNFINGKKHGYKRAEVFYRIR
ncbi:MAG: PIG-L deacetylase family protein [archaeon]